MRKTHFKNTSSRIEKYLSESDRPRIAREVAEFLGTSETYANSTLHLMEVFGTVQKVVRRGRHYYFLKGIYSEEQISAMLPPKKVKPKPRRRSILRSPSVSKFPAQKSFLEEHISTIRAQASSVEGPPALAMVGLTQQEMIEEEALTEELPIELEVEERRFETPKNIEPFATIQHLPKAVRRLTIGQAKYLKEQLKFLEGYDGIERFNMAFAEFSALEHGSFGTVFYFSMGTNPWERVHRVQVDVPILLEMEKPVKRPRRKRRSKYDPIIDQFIELGQDLVEINVKGRKSTYVKSQLMRRIKDRGLEISASSAGGLVYLERKGRRRLHVGSRDGYDDNRNAG